MKTRIIPGSIRNGKIIPSLPLPKGSRLDVKILLIPRVGTGSQRAKHRGSMPTRWGDPIKYQKMTRKEMER